MVYAVRWFFILSTAIFLLSCKKDDGFNFLEGSGGGSSNVDQLKIDDFSPQGDPLVIEIGDTQEFDIDALAPIGRNISYAWYLNNTSQNNINDKFTLTGSLANVGNYSLKVVANDSKSSVEKIWNVKINEAPSLSPITTGVPKVSVGSAILLTASSIDNNNDTLTYTWLLNGAPSSLLVGSGATATLTGDALNLGNITVTVEANDGTATDSYTWNAEVNYFPQPCNELAQNEICTYGGNPSLGDNTNPLTNPNSVRIRPIAQVQDAIGNYFIADYDNAVVWYWNQTSAAVQRVGLQIPANTLKVVAGTGEYSTGGDGMALETAINQPRGLWYDDANDRLFISDYNGNLVRYVDNTGFMYTGMGSGTSNTDGNPASTHDCDRPTTLYHHSGSIYVACYNTHRVKRWDLTTDLAYTVYGNGTNAIGADGSAPTAAGAANPYDIFITNEGMYVAHMAHHRIRFVNFGANKNFWAGTPSATTVVANTVRTIIGTGAGGATASGNSLAVNIGNPSGVVVVGNSIYFHIRDGNNDRFYLANNSGSNITIGSITIPLGTTGRFTNTAAGYNGDDVAINSAQISEAYSLSVDPLDSNILTFSDYNNYRLRRINLNTGRAEIVLGSGRLRSGFNGDIQLPTLDYLFNRPNGLTFQNSTKTLFLVDQDNSRTRSIDQFGQVTTVLGRGQGNPALDNDYPTNAFMFTALNGTNNQLNGIGLLPDGSLLQLNSRVHNFRIWNRTSAAKTYADVFIPDGLVSNVAGNYAVAAGNGPAGAALNSLMNFPSDIIAYDNSGSLEIFVVDQQNHCVKMLNSLGQISFAIGNCGDATPTDSTHNVLLAALEMNRPHGIAIDEFGNLIISDTYNNKIRYWNRTASSVTFGNQTINPGFVTTIACFSGTGGSTAENIFASSARCDSPMGLDYRNGVLCFANFARHNVRCINRVDGRINTVAGRPVAINRSGGPVGMEQEGVLATSVPLNNPVDVTFDDQGDIYISDRNNHIVRKVKLSP